MFILHVCTFQKQRRKLIVFDKQTSRVKSQEEVVCNVWQRSVRGMIDDMLSVERTATSNHCSM